MKNQQMTIRLKEASAANEEVKQLRVKLQDEIDRGFARDNEAKQVIDHMQELLVENTRANKKNFTEVVNPFDDTKKIWVPTRHFRNYSLNAPVSRTVTETVNDDSQ